MLNQTVELYLNDLELIFNKDKEVLEINYLHDHQTLPVGIFTTTGDGGWKFETWRDNILDYPNLLEEELCKLIKLGLYILKVVA